MKNNKFNLKDELVLIEGTKEWFKVVEFIKRLKKEFKGKIWSDDNINKKIDKLAGLKLIR